MLQVATRLLEFAVVRAKEMKLAAAAATSGQGESSVAASLEENAVQSARIGESRIPCKLRLKTAQVRSVTVADSLHCFWQDAFSGHPFKSSRYSS